MSAPSLNGGPAEAGDSASAAAAERSQRLGLRIARLFHPYRGRVAVIAVTILFGSGLNAINPLLIRTVFDRALFVPGGPNLRLLYLLVGAMVLIPIVAGAIQVGQTYLTNAVGNRVMQDLRDRLYEHLHRMPLSFFTATRTGEIQSRLANDVGGVESVVTNTASSILSNVVVIASTLVAMVILSWLLTVITLILVPVFVVLTRRVGQQRRAVAGQTQSSLADMSAITQETLSISGVLLAKVFDRQADEIARYRAESARLAGLQVRQQMVGRTFYALVQAFFAITPAFIYLAAGLSLAGGGIGHLSPGTLVAFTTLQTRLLFPINQMLQVSVQVQSSLALFGRVFDYLDLEPDIVDAPDAIELARSNARGEIRLQNVFFRYPQTASHDGQSWTLRDVSLEVSPGQLAALVGPSGAGKTTISYLIPRLYDVTRGAVTIDGIDVRKIRLSSLADLVGLVTQESYLFHASVRENLRYANRDASDAQLEAAARAAHIHERIVELDDGYDTLVGERGYRLSGGEKQRLAIARVILKDPRILILDEATAALDTTSERLVQSALEPLMADRTTIAIAHRLSTILAADVIFVVDGGRIVERGTHEDLLGSGGLYASLYEQQFQGGKLESRCSDGVVLAGGGVVRTGVATGETG